MAEDNTSIITRLGEFIDRPDTLNELGKRLVIQAVKSAVEEKLGQKTASPMAVRRVAAGEVVPPDLRAEAGIVMAEAHVAASGWDKSWLNLVIWDKSWAEDQEMAATPDLGLSDPAAIFRLETVLTPEEFAVVQRLKIVS